MLRHGHTPAVTIRMTISHGRYTDPIAYCSPTWITIADAIADGQTEGIIADLDFSWHWRATDLAAIVRITDEGRTVTVGVDADGTLYGSASGLLTDAEWTHLGRAARGTTPGVRLGPRHLRWTVEPLPHPQPIPTTV